MKAFRINIEKLREYEREIFKNNNVNAYKTEDKDKEYKRILKRFFKTEIIKNAEEYDNFMGIKERRYELDYGHGIDYIIYDHVRCKHITIDVKDFKSVRGNYINVEIWNEKGRTWLEHSKADYFLFRLETIKKCVLVEREALKKYVHSLGFRNGRIPKNAKREIKEAVDPVRRNNKWIELSFEEIEGYCKIMPLFDL